jgi:hypothetical protein
MGSIILNGKQVDYLIQTDETGYVDLQVRWARLTRVERAYDHSFIFSDGGEGLAECDKKFPGLRALLAKRFPELNLNLEA